MATTFKGILVPSFILVDRFGEKIAKLFQDKEFEDLAAVDAWCARTKGIGPKTQKGFHLLIVDVMKSHNNPGSKQEPKVVPHLAPGHPPVGSHVETKKEVKLPLVLKTIGYEKAKDPAHQALFEKLCAGLEREETDKLVRFRINPEVYKAHHTEAYKFIGFIKARLQKLGKKVSFGGGWLLVIK